MKLTTLFFQERQTLFFSATLSPGVQDLASKFCKENSVVISSNNTNRRITQKFELVPYANRKEYLINMVRDSKFFLNYEKRLLLCF
jgi:superfamily II DNA/RNA helicase